MKIRTDFVTNSSSSSFIIATKKDITYAEIRAIIEQDDTWYDKYVSALKQRYRGYTDAKINDMILSKEDMIDSVVDNIYYGVNIYNHVNIGEFSAFVKTVDSDDYFSEFDWFLEVFRCNNDKLVIGIGDC